MKTFRFKKRKIHSYTIYTVVAVFLSIFIFTGLNTYINKQIAYLLVAGLSFIAILSAVKKSGKEFEEIIVLEEERCIKFYFQNKLKEPLTVAKSEISIIILEDAVDFELKSKKLIGSALKTNLEVEYKWVDFLNSIS